MRPPSRRVLVAALVVGGLVTAALLGVAASPVGADGNEAPGNPAAARGLTVGDSQACAIVPDGSVRCWGLNSSGQLGVGDATSRGDTASEMGALLPAVSLGTGRTATALAAGSTHTCALLDNGTVKCWGNGTNGRLGVGDIAAHGDGPNEMGDNLPAVPLGTGRTATAVSAGTAHTCALLDNGTVKCWGANGSGQLGQGDTASRGDTANELGDTLPAIALGTGRTATAISAGGNQTCALLDNGTVKCWGNGANGQLGQGNTTTRGDGANEMGDNLPAINLGTGRTATALTTGNLHVCALLDNASVKCWGFNSSGQLGVGDVSARGDAASEMGDNLLAVNLGTGRTATAIAAGGNHTCALLDNGSVKCWGSGLAGGTGQGSTAAIADLPNETGDNLPPVALGTGRTATAVATGTSFTCVTLDDGSRKCWGESGSGQLGAESTVDRGDGPNEMGDNLPRVFLSPAGLLTGTVTDAVSGQPIAGGVVVALRTADFSVGASAIADGTGNYQVNAPTGTYFLYLLDPTANHTDGFFGAPQQFTVTNGGTLNTPLTMAPKRGGFSGTVSEQGTGQPLASVEVFAIGNSGIVAGTTTDAAGTYTLANLPVGNYHAVFVDGIGRRTPEYWDNSPDFAGSTGFAVTAGATTPGIDAALTRP